MSSQTEELKMRSMSFILASLIVVGCSSTPMTREEWENRDRIEKHQRQREQALCDMNGGCPTYNPRIPNRSNRAPTK